MNISISKNFYDISIIPKNWTEKRLKNILSISENKSSNFNNEKILSLTKKGIVINDITSNKGQIAESYEKYIKVKKGQICMNPMDLLSGWVDISNFEGLISPAYYTFELNKEVENKFINYFLQSNYLRKTFFKLGKGVASHDNFGRWVLTPEELKNICLFIPNIDEQKLISCYLDKKTTQIDSLVNKIEKKIELLKEQRTSLINQCVTKGLDLNVEMKDSGVEWIGKIPKHWNLCRLATLGSFSKGKNITKDELTENGKPVILYSHLYTTYTRATNLTKHFISEEKFLETTKISKDTFLFTSSGESVEEIGKTLLYCGDSEISVGGDMVIFNLNPSLKISPDFLSYSLNSDNCQHQKSSMSRGEIVVHVYEKQLREVFVAIPPLLEQTQIKNKLEQHERSSSNLIGCFKRKIERLIEFRQSLISSAVTGKVRITEDMV